MSLPQNAIRMYVNLDGSKNRTAEGAIQGFSNGATVYQLLAPIATFPTLAVNVTYELFDGDQIPDTLRFVGEIQVENPAGSGLFETWNLWEKGLTQEVTGNATSQGQDLQIQSFFVDTSEEEVTVDTVPTYTETFAVGKSTTPLVIRFSPGDKADLQAQIDDKRDRNNSSLPVQEAGIPDDFSYTAFDPTSASEKRLSHVTLKNDILGGADIAESFATFADSGINNPNLAGNFTIRVNRPSNALEPDYNDTAQTLAVDPIPIIDTVIAGSITRPGDLPAGTFINLEINNFISVMKAVGFPDFVFRTEYFVRNAGVINPIPVLVGIENTVSSTILGQIPNTDTIPTVTLGVGDEIIFQTVVRSTTGSVSKGTAQFMGVPRTTWSRFRFEAGTISSGKMNKILVPVENNLVKQGIDGDVIDAEIGVDEVLLENQDEVITGAWTFNDILTALNGMNITGPLTVDGDFFVVNGNAGEILTDEFKVEDLVATYAVDNPTAAVQTGHEFEIGPGVKWAYTRDADGEFRLGLTTDKKLVAFIQDNPQENLILTYDSATKTLINRTNQDILDLLNIQISDVEDLQDELNTLQNNIDDKITGIQVNTFTDITEVEFIGGSTVTNPLTGKVTVDIFGDGIGEGIIVLGQADNDVIIGPSPGIPVTETVLSWTTQIGGQSDDINVFELFDQNDVTIPNTIQIKKTASEDLGNPLKYRVFLQGVATNPNNNVSAILTFTAKKDDAPVWSRTRTIGPGNASADQTNNFGIEEFITTNELLLTEDVQLFIEADIAGVSLDSLEIHFTTNFVSGESLPDVMRTPVYDVNKLGKVDKSQESEGATLHQTTNPSTSLLNSTKTGALIEGVVYLIELQPTMTVAQIQWSPLGDATIFDVYESDGVTEALGTSYNNLDTNYLAALFTSGDLIIQSLDKRLETIEATLIANPVLEPMTELSHTITTTNPLGIFDYRDIKGLTVNQILDNTNSFGNWTTISGTAFTVTNNYMNIIGDSAQNTQNSPKTLSIKEATVYTLLYSVLSNTLDDEARIGGSGSDWMESPSTIIIPAGTTGVFKVLVTSRATIVDGVNNFHQVFASLEATTGNIEIRHAILEGDQTSLDDSTALKIINDIDLGLESVSKELEFKALNTDTSYQTAKQNYESDLRSIQFTIIDIANNGNVDRVTNESAILNGVAVNLANFPDAFDTGIFTIYYSGGQQDGIIGTDSALQDGTLHYQIVEVIEPYIETRESNVQDFEVAIGVIVTQENTTLGADLDVEVSQTLKDTTNDNREQANKNADAISKLHRDFSFTFIQGTWENVDFAPKWSYTITDSRILTKDEVGFAPDNNTEDIWNTARPFTQGVQDEVTGQAIFLARSQPTADVIGLILLKGVVVDG